MSSRPLRRVVLALTCVLPLTLGAAAPSAGAERAPDPAVEAHERVVAFWTAERRASATPAEVVLSDPRPNGKPPWAGGGGGPGGGGDDPPPPPSSGPAPTDVVTGEQWTHGGAVAVTSGKVFFTDPANGGRYVCSGSVVQSPHDDLVVTAGHCVHGSAGFMTDWVFYPGYDSGPGDAGAFTANEAGDEGELYTTVDWKDDGDFQDDLGFARVVQPGTTLEAATSAAPTPAIAFDGAAGADGFHSSFGYPAAKKYKGRTLTWCQGDVAHAAFDGADTMSMACDMTGGSSGGQWFRAYDFTDAMVNPPTIASVNSYGYSSLKGYMFGPVLGTEEAAAYVAATS